MNWTKSQLEAINEENKNIIVSAGAGSGKTAVLTERVIRKLKQGVSINDLLILTFTNAAAAEMKRRIRQKIINEPSLKDELSLIDSSYITTFDSFALSLVSQYHYLLNIKKDVAIIDENVMYLEMSKKIDDIFNRLYENKDPNFLKMVSDLCVKDDSIIKEGIIDIYEKLNLRLDKKNYLENYLNYYYEDKQINYFIEKYLKIIKVKINDLYEQYGDLVSLCNDKYATKLEMAVMPLFNANDLETIKIEINNLKLPNLPKYSSDELKKIKEKFKENVNDLKNFIRFQNVSEIKKSIKLTKPYAEIIIKIINLLDSYLEQIKKEYDNYTFLDIAKMAYRVVLENENIRNDLKHRFNEIMIDEYQDTSDIQEAFINLISNNNVYMVGDLKQSIYRFRNANPSIFKNKYEKYRQKKSGIKIDLLENFRSRKEVIDNINYIFIKIMTDNLGGVNYYKDGQMKFGNKQYEINKPKQNYNFEVYNYIDFLDKGFSKREIEAFIICEDIKKRVKSDFVFDKGKYRKAKYSDFTILVDRGKDFNLYKKIFEYYQIPLNIYENETITNEYDIFVINNIMKLIIKIKNREMDLEFKYLFTSIARSFLCSLNDNDIFKYFINNQFYDSEIYRKCKEISLSLDYLSNKEFLETIIQDFNFYEKIITIGSIENILVRIEYLISLAENLGNNGYSVYDFTNFISEMIDNKRKITYSLDKSSGEGVKIMNIHKSKGLEFNYCYYSGLYYSFNKEDLKKRFIFDNEYGLICPYYEEGINDTIYKDLYKEKTKQENLSERVRLFYVALTRCKEKMIFLTDFNMDLEHNIDKINSFKDLLLKIPIRNRTKLLKFKDYHLTLDYKKLKISNYQKYIDKEKKYIVEEIKIFPKIKNKKRYSKSVNKLITKEEQENMEFGTKLHYFLEIIDLKKPNLEKMNIDNKLIMDKIKSFLNCDLLKNIKKAKIYKEYEFINGDSIGIIDLMLEFDDYIYIIDYKTKNIDDEAYFKQILGYKDYIYKKTKKRVKAYLYSLMDEKYYFVGGNDE